MQIKKETTITTYQVRNINEKPTAIATTVLLSDLSEKEKIFLIKNWKNDPDTILDFLKVAASINQEIEEILKDDVFVAKVTKISEILDTIKKETL